jgi:adenylate cyclase
VLFAEVRGSTAMGERLDPSAYAAVMNRFYKAATKVLVDHDAILDKLIGDEVMALFIPGLSGPDYLRKAAESGVALLEAVKDKETGHPWLDIGVAVHAGPAYVGNVGSEGMADFTALGDTVNTAARLQGVAAAGQVVLSDAAYAAVAGRFPDIEPQNVSLRGKEEPMSVRVLSSAKST